MPVDGRPRSTHLTKHPRVGRTTVLQARLAAAEAALKAVDLQRHDLTAERSAWLDQLQQENVSLRGVYEEAKQAKERLVEVRARLMHTTPTTTIPPPPLLLPQHSTATALDESAQ